MCHRARKSSQSVLSRARKFISVSDISTKVCGFHKDFLSSTCLWNWVSLSRDVHSCLNNSPKCCLLDEKMTNIAGLSVLSMNGRICFFSLHDRYEDILHILTFMWWKSFRSFQGDTSISILTVFKELLKFNFSNSNREFSSWSLITLHEIEELWTLEQDFCFWEFFFIGSTVGQIGTWLLWLMEPSHDGTSTEHTEIRNWQLILVVVGGCNGRDSHRFCNRKSSIDVPWKEKTSCRLNGVAYSVDNQFFNRYFLLGIS